jgi:RNA polymerase sigma-70 factor (ECF subfamily)
MGSAAEPWERIGRLVRRARHGDEAAFAELLESHREVVIATLVACGVRCRETARDLAQDVALRAWQGLGRLEDPRAFPAWIRRIAANAARDHLRRLAVRRERALDEALELAGDEDPHGRSERRAELRLMLAVLEAEDEESRTLVLARAGGVSVAELARRLGLSEGAVKMRLLRARQRLRRRLEAIREGRT